ncbi:hypothetical protein [Parasphingorhabdus pacifica]
MSGFDARIWRALNRILLVLAIGVLGLLLGLGPNPERGDSVFGLIIVLIVTLPVIVPFWRQSPRERRVWKQWPRRRPLVTATAAVLGCVALLVLWWTIANVLSPGTLSPLSLALVGVALAAALALVGNLVRRV